MCCYSTKMNVELLGTDVDKCAASELFVLRNAVWLSTKASRTIPRLTRHKAMSYNTLPAPGMTVSSLLCPYRGNPPPLHESASGTHVATCIPIMLIRARFVAEEGGGRR